LVVIGVTSRGAEWASDLIRDAYLPHTLFESNSKFDSSSNYDRLRCEVENESRVEEGSTTRVILVLSSLSLMSTIPLLVRPSRVRANL
jgi:hypothetical protein